MSDSAFSDYYKYGVLATACYVRLGDQSAELRTDGATFVAAADRQDDGRIPKVLGEKLFVRSDTNENVWSILNYYGGDIPASQDAVAGDDKSGFAATLFKQGTEKVLAVRGTEPNADRHWDLLAADLGEIGILGLALAQVVSMVNLIERLKGTPGDRVTQIGLNLSTSQPSGPFLPVAGTRPVYLSFSTYTAGAVGGIDPGDKVKVTGHSLGGHLAVIAARLFPAVFDQEVFVYDAAGYDPTTADYANLAGLLNPLVTIPVIELLKRYLANDLGTAAESLIPEANQLTNSALEQIQMRLTGAADPVLVGMPAIINLTTEDILPGDDADVVSSRLTGAEKYGAPVEVPSEADSHAMEVFMDVLALHAVLGRLNEDLTLPQAADLLKAASPDLNTSEERLTEALFRLLVPGQDLPGGGKHLLTSDATGGLTGSLLSGKGDLAARAQFHDAVLQINAAIDSKPSLRLEPLTDRTAESLKRLAADGADPDSMAYRYALRELNPFAILGSTEIYDPHNREHELDLYQATDDAGQEGTGLTDRWLEARARFLEALIKYNSTDAAGGAQGVGGYFEDQRLDIKLGLNAGGRDRFVFGADSDAKTLIGFDGSDYLFGGTADDTIGAGPGDDYADGGGGADTILGGAGNDELYGGAGDDLSITGDEGDDLLVGGSGDDRDMRGGTGADRLWGDEQEESERYAGANYSGKDKLYGEDGSDYL